MIEALLAFLARVALGTFLLVLLFLCVWLWKHGEALTYLTKSRDKKWPATEDPEVASSKATQRRSVTLVFVRHGESTWNITFNKSKNPIFFIPRILYSVAYEAYLIATGVRDSWFYDAPLSTLGINEATQLRSHLATATVTDPREVSLLQVLRGERGRSVIVSSCLRRAVSTAIVAFWDRIKRTGESITVLPCLQEISTNPDTLSITPPATSPVPSWIEKTHSVYNFSSILSSQVDVSQHIGNKPVDSNGLKRMKAFCDWAFEEEHDAVVVVGHSLWFRYFFREFLPRDFKFAGKDNKIVNGGAVSLELEQLSGGSLDRPHYRINPDSIKTVFGGFLTKDSKKD